MYDSNQIVPRTNFNHILQNSINGSYYSRCNKITPGESARKGERNNQGDEKVLPFKIPMAYVISGAEELCSQAKFTNYKHVEQVKRTYRIDENFKQLHERSRSQDSIDIVILKNDI